MAESRFTRTGVKRRKKRMLIALAVASFGLAASPAALADPPPSVPPSGATCGAFYGSVISTAAKAGVLGGNVNPGNLHQGFAGVEAFPGFVCP
jgi:hypothetical protein